MMKKNKINKILKAITPDPVLADFSNFDKQIESLKSQLREKITLRTLEEVSKEMKKLEKRINLQPFIDSMDSLRNSFDTKSKQLFDEIEEKSIELSKSDKQRVEDVRRMIQLIKDEIDLLKNEHTNALIQLSEKIPQTDILEKNINQIITDITARLSILENVEEPEIVDWQKKIDQLKKELIFQISQIGGGSMNRQIKIGGIDYLTRYTDINIKAGSNVSITAVNNDTIKAVDITISASGGGLNFEIPVGTVNDSNVTFTVSNEPEYINVNGAQYTVGLGLYASYVAGTITLTSPVGTGGFIISAY